MIPVTAIIAIPDRGDDPARRGLDHSRKHAVLDAERSFVLQEDDPIAGGEPTGAVFRPKAKTGGNDPAFDQFLARQLVQRAHITSPVGED